MAIELTHRTNSKPTAVKEFTDRIELQKAFWSCYNKLTEGSTIIAFYGADGVGKTRLLKKLESDIKRSGAITNDKCVYANYDFNISTDSREVLKTLKFQLSDYGCNFPLFDVGNYYYSLKTGQDITPPKARSMMEKIPWLNELKKNLLKAYKIAGQANSLFKFFEMTESVLQTIPVMKAVTTCFSIADRLLLLYMEKNQILDDEHKELHRQLNERCQDKNPVALYEYLPALFAQDVADWLEDTGNKLVVFLDNYESLISATALATNEQLRHDLWLRGDEGLIYRIPQTLWVIAGRNKLRWDSELADEMEQHLIKALSPKDADWFLQKAGIQNENLRGELVKLTGGYPIFLDLCVDGYVEYTWRYGEEPTIDKFGQKRQDVVGRIFRYLDAAGDDAAKDMLEFLCVLNVWTDDIAVNIGKQTLRNFSYSTYKRIKNASFIQKSRIENDDVDLTICRFDRTIRNILIAACDKKLIADIKSTVNDYLPKFFAENSTASNAKNIFCFKLWAELIVHFATDSLSLVKQYNIVLAERVAALTNRAKYDAAEEILNLFMSKIESFGDSNGLSYAKFEIYLGSLKLTQGKYNEAYKITKSAYEKFARLLGEEHIDTINTLNSLASTLRYRKRYDKALTLQEKVLTLRKKFLGKKHPDTISAMNNLAVILSDLGRYDEALKLQEKILELRKKNLGEKNLDTIRAMSNLAITLSDLERYDKALKFQEKILELRREILGEKNLDTIRAMNNLAITLRFLGRYNEVLTLQKKVFVLRREILGEKHPNTINAVNNLISTLRYVGRDDKAEALRKEFFGEEFPPAINDNEVLKLQERILASRKKILGEEYPNTLMAMHNLAMTLRDLGRRGESLILQEKALPLFKKVFGEENSYTIGVMCDLAQTLYNGGARKKAIPVIDAALKKAPKIFGEDNILIEQIKFLHDKILNLYYLKFFVADGG